MSALAKAVLGEAEDDLRKFVRKAGQLGPYRDFKTVLRFCRQLPEYAANPGGSTIWFESQDSVPDARTKFDWKWMALLRKWEDGSLAMELMYYTNEPGTGGVWRGTRGRRIRLDAVAGTAGRTGYWYRGRPRGSIQKLLWADFDKFMERLRKIAVIRDVDYNIGDLTPGL